MGSSFSPRSSATKVLWVGLVVLLVLQLAFSTRPSAAQGPEDHVEGRVLVELRPGTPADRVAPRHRPVLGRWIEVAVGPGETVQQAADRLSTVPGVASVHLDRYLHAFGRSRVDALASFPEEDPDDPLYPLQWNFPAAGIPGAWPSSGGAGVVVAVVDSGVTKGGEDLTCRDLVHDYDAVEQSSGPGSADDGDGHGTHIAGTIAQCTDNAVGVAGIAHQATLMPIDVFDEVGAPSSAVARGIDWARTHGADVINLSLGEDCFDDWPACSIPVINTALEAASAAGVVIVAASGNSGASWVAHPANHPDVIAVGAVDANSSRAAYSSYGSSLDLVAPGGTQDLGVMQETFAHLCGGPDDGSLDYCELQGTSMAAAHVSGSAALARALVPSAPASLVRDAIQCSALDLGQAGPDPFHGTGLLRADLALRALEHGGCTPSWPPGSSLLAPDILEAEVRLLWTAASDDQGVTAYRLSLNGHPIFTLGANVTDHWVTGLQPATSYAFRVEAGDAQGRWSETGPGLTIITAPDFLDTMGHQFEADIAWLAGAGITKGCVLGEPRYCPDRSVTRGEMAAFLRRALRLPEPASDHFADDQGNQFEADINAIAEAAITRGCGEGIYCPDQEVTRAEMAAFLSRAFALPPSGIDHFSDDDGQLLEPEIDSLAEAQITRGCTADGSQYCPDRPVTRGEMAAFLRRSLTR